MICERRNGLTSLDLREYIAGDERGAVPCAAHRDAGLGCSIVMVKQQGRWRRWSRAAEQQEQTDRAEQFVLNEDVRTKLRHS